MKTDLATLSNDDLRAILFADSEPRAVKSEAIMLLEDRALENGRVKALRGLSVQQAIVETAKAERDEEMEEGGWARGMGE